MSESKLQYRIFERISDVDISEQDIYDYDPILRITEKAEHTGFREISIVTILPVPAVAVLVFFPEFLVSLVSFGIQNDIDL